MISSLYIAGLGLIGGSFAQKAAQFPKLRLSGWDRDNEFQRASGLCTEGIDSADLILLCMPPAANIAFLKEKSALFKQGAIVANCAGTQREAMASCPQGIAYIGAHPMAGSEEKGYNSARPNLFDGAPLILCPSSSFPADYLPPLTSFFRSLGFGNISSMDAARHDHLVSLISQLPHVLAALLIDLQTEESAALSGGSLDDMTRIAAFNAPLWAELFRSNCTELNAVLSLYSAGIRRFQEALKAPTENPLIRLLEESTKKRSAFFPKNIDIRDKGVV